MLLQWYTIDIFYDRHVLDQLKTLENLGYQVYAFHEPLLLKAGVALSYVYRRGLSVQGAMSKYSA